MFGFYASILGTWIAGGIILNVDSTHPDDYKQTILRESKAKIVIQIRSSAWQGFAVEDRDLFFLSINEEQTLKASFMPLPVATLEDCAYIFFTSGTTNIPKGILGTHAGLSHFVTWQKEQFNIGAKDRCAQITNISFDVILREIFTPLISGATLCIPLASEKIESGHFFEYLDRERITAIHLVPTLLDFLLLHSKKFPNLLHLRWIFCAGEPLHDHLVKRWREKFPRSGKLINMYGPTETTLAKAFFEVPDDVYAGVQPIGKPLPQTQIFILNQAGGQCGVGELGEICIYTPYKTRGYLNLPTEQKNFEKHPWVDDPEAFIYHSGDLGYIDADENIHIIGRLDDQLKINGVRINPNQIASAILKNFSIKQCAVVSKENENHELKLVAYIVPEDDAKALILKKEINAFLRAHYSSYYIPSAIMFIDRIPYTSRGKIDKKALPQPVFTEPNENNLQMQELEAEFNETQLGLKEFCENSLKIRINNPHTNLFDVGMDSLGCLELIMHINQTYNASIDFKEFREMETLHKISERIRNDAGKEVLITKTGMSIEELQKFVLLPDSISESIPYTASNASFKQIFMTGATGFLGSYILSEVMQNHPDVHIYCLIRARDKEKALQKITYALTKYNHTIKDFDNQVIPILGDLSKPWLGLTQEAFENLSREVDLIYHCGAAVHFTSKFGQLYPTNVESAKTIIELAKLSKITSLHYISTAGIYPISSKSSNKIIQDDELFESEEILNTGYAQTKWIADQLMAQAREHDLPVTIYRPGEISGDSKTGVWNEDAIFRFIQGCIKMKTLPDLPTRVDLTPAK